MRIFCIHTLEDPKSIAGGIRAKESAAKLGLEVELFSAVFYKDADKVADKHGLKIKYKGVLGRRTDFINMTCPRVRIGNGLSHFLLYKKCIEIKEPIVILEHDAVFLGLPPTAIDSKEIVQISSHKPFQITPKLWHTSGRSKKMRQFGSQYDIDKLDKHFLWDWPEKGIIEHPLSGTVGTSGYIIGHEAAARMVSYLTKDGLGFADRIREDHIGKGNLKLQVPQSVICMNDILSTSNLG